MTITTTNKPCSWNGRRCTPYGAWGPSLAVEGLADDPVGTAMQDAVVQLVKDVRWRWLLQELEAAAMKVLESGKQVEDLLTQKQASLAASRSDFERKQTEVQTAGLDLRLSLSTS